MARIRSIAPAEIGGGVVRRALTLAGERVQPGTELTGDQIRAISPANRQALIENQMIEVWPRSRDGAAGGRPTERFMVSLGGGKFGVVEGWAITDKPLTHAEARALVKSGAAIETAPPGETASAQEDTKAQAAA